MQEWPAGENQGRMRAGRAEYEVKTGGNQVSSAVGLLLVGASQLGRRRHFWHLWVKISIHHLQCSGVAGRLVFSY